MSDTLHFKFESDLEYQRRAIDSVLGLFEGQPLAQESYSIAVGQSGSSQLTLESENFYGIPAVANQMLLPDKELLKNLNKVQEQNNIPLQSALEGRHFSVEMETGTGKTYVYLRTLFELHQIYGFTKFIIVVPSVAIREGVSKSLEMMQQHFADLYNKPEYDYFVYEAGKLGQVRQFATSNKLQIMVINIQAFDKATAVMNQENDRMSGAKPIDFIRATNPILIIDEPQSVEGDTSREKTKRAEALESLNHLCTLRYSATHKNPYNLIYVLNPIDAYDLGLVKQIEVASLTEGQSFNSTYISLASVDNRNGIKAKVNINVQEGNGPKKKNVQVKQGDDLFVKSKERLEYQDNWIVNNISCEPGDEHIEFSNGTLVRLGQEMGGLGDAMMKAQVQEAVEQHFRKERALRGKGIKVLSLFFIDKVENYRIYKDDGTTELGKIGVWFEEAFKETSNKTLYKGLISFPVEKIHNGYFSQDRQGRPKDTTGKTKDDEDTYALIMREKEKLLSDDVPLRFIFSHSALREGWDNPNVFQICTLNESSSADRKRQEIGRGLRLAVNQNGERVRDKTVNRLTVIANESYDDFSRQLQTEYEQDYGIQFGKVQINVFAKLANPATKQYLELGQSVSEQIHQFLTDKGYLDANGRLTAKFDPQKKDFVLELPDEWKHMHSIIIDELNKYCLKSRVVNVRDRKELTFRKNVVLDPTFRELWEKISQRTRFRVRFDTKQLVENASRAIREMPAIHKTRITTALYAHRINQAGMEGEQITGGVRDVESNYTLPDILAYLQNDTELTRHTLVEILKKSERLSDFIRNPQVFINQVTKCINHELHRVTVNGIEYEKIGGSVYEMHELEQDAENITRYMENLYKVQNLDKTFFDYVEYESSVEADFAKACDLDERVKFYCKLPSRFKVDTPVGSYNPDWAIVTESDQKVYLVRETKSTRDLTQLRQDEQDKIRCGKKHFETIDVDFAVVTNLNEALNG